MVIKTVIDSKELYKLYLASTKSTNKPTVDFETYKKILKTYSEVLSDTLIEDGQVTFCGTILKIIIGREKGHGVDHKLSSEYNTKVYNFNEHTFGWVANIIWDDFGLKKKKNYLFKRSDMLSDALAKRLQSIPKHILNYQMKLKRHG